MMKVISSNVSLRDEQFLPSPPPSSLSAGGNKGDTNRNRHTYFCEQKQRQVDLCLMLISLARVVQELTHE